MVWTTRCARLKEVTTRFHTAVVDDVPEDTGVFHVLARTPRVPELIASKKYMYQIAIDGTITLLGKTEDIIGIGKQPSPR